MWIASPRVKTRSPCLAVLALVASAVACDRKPPPGADSARAPEPSAVSHAPIGRPTLPEELEHPPAPSSSSAAAPAPKASEYTGPWLAVTASDAGVFSERSFDRKAKIGWVRNGGRVPVAPDPEKNAACTRGWYRVLSGGFICGNSGTTNLDDTDVKLALKAPNLDEVLPYRYARNAKNGTPLYHSVPSREQMLKYEPYLDPDKKAKSDADPGAEKTKPASDKTETTTDSVLQHHLETVLQDAGVSLTPPPGEAEPDVPWWQREDAKEHLHELKLEHLSEEADGVIEKRMVAGFYVAVDRTFTWNGRTWYKTTKGLVAPADRFWETAGSDFKGVDVDGDKWKLPIAWVYGGRKNAQLYRIDEAAGTIKPEGSSDHFAPIALSGRSLDFKHTTYRETRDGLWIRERDVRIAEPGAPPAELGPNERWVDVNLGQQTLVVLEGTRPIYATLISSGKESKIEEKDHRTPTGQWRIREKHLTTTMDGDGTAAGDLPYSIEDVPYVMYFHRAFALHGAFWHRNYGVQMSHGCVNLSPLDAKRVFFLTDPPLPEGFHGVWASKEHPGSLVVVHD